MLSLALLRIRVRLMNRQKGDTNASIAAEMGVSLRTLYRAKKLIKEKRQKVRRHSEWSRTVHSEWPRTVTLKDGTQELRVYTLTPSFGY